MKIRWVAASSLLALCAALSFFQLAATQKNDDQPASEGGGFCLLFVLIPTALASWGFLSLISAVIG
ncbi:MAG: hypothetical protein WC841_02975 [Candidatus Shapirobacteria bacterium]